MSAESEFLAVQSRLARERCTHTAHALVDEVLEPLDLRANVRRRPWRSLGAAALSGFVGGIALGGRSRGRAARSGFGATVRHQFRRVVRSFVGTWLVANFGGETRSARGTTDSTSSHNSPDSVESGADA